MKLKKILMMSVFAFTALIFAACELDPDGGQDQKPGDASVTVNNKTIELSAGGTARISYATKPEGAKVVFSSNDEEIAIVSDKGIVTAMAEGDAVITVALASDATVKDVANVKVLSQAAELEKKTFQYASTWNKWAKELTVKNTIWMNKEGTDVAQLSTSDGTKFSVDSLCLYYFFIWTEDQGFDGNTMIGNGMLVNVPVSVPYAKSSQDGRYYIFPFWEYTIDAPAEAFREVNSKEVENRCGYDKIPRVMHASNSENFDLYKYRNFITQVFTEGGDPKPYAEFKDAREPVVLYWTAIEGKDPAINVHGYVKGQGGFNLEPPTSGDTYNVTWFDATLALFQGHSNNLGMEVALNPEDGNYYPAVDEENLIVINTKDVHFESGEKPKQEESNAMREPLPVRADVFRNMQKLSEISNISLSIALSDCSKLQAR